MSEGRSIYGNKMSFFLDRLSSLMALLRWRETRGGPEVGGPGAARRPLCLLSLAIRP